MRKNTKVFATAAALALVGASLAGCTATPNDRDLTPEQIEEFEDIYTFHERTFECPVDELDLIRTVIYAVPAYGPGSDASPKRVTADAPSIPLVGSTDAEYYANYEQQLCVNPHVAFMEGYRLGNRKVPGTDTRLFDLEGNDVLKLADVKLSEINNLAREYVFEEGDDRDEFMQNNDALQEYVSVLVSVLHQFQPIGVYSPTSTKNWSIEVGSASIPNWIVSNYQESLPAILYAAIPKGQCIPADLFGVNLQDQRPEEFNEKEFTQFCDTPPTKTKCFGDDCGGEPPCTINCEPPCVYDCPKDRSDDPSNPGGVTPQGPDAEEPEAPLPPALPLDPDTPVPADPSPEASPPGEPSVDPNAPPATPAPTPIGDPDAG